MNSVLRVWMTSCLLAAVLIGCATPQGDRRATSVVDFLYPNEKEPVAEQGIPVLKLPMRVGIAFVPETDRYRPERITEARKGQLLEEVSEHFRSRDFIRGIEIIPSAYLRSKGGFENLDQIRAMFGVDVIALVSYHQTQFTDEGVLSLAYWTIIGAYVVRGEKNSTHTMVDAVVLDIPSRKMLFRAPGISFVKGSATPVNLREQLRLDAEKGFGDAVAEMIANLDQELAAFQERVKSNPEEYRVVRTGGYTGSGALEPWHSVCLALLAGCGGLWSARRRE